MSNAENYRAMTRPSDRVVDRPPSDGSKLFPTAGGVSIIFLFYLFVAATILFLAAWISVEVMFGFVGGQTSTCARRANGGRLKGQWETTSKGQKQSLILQEH